MKNQIVVVLGGTGGIGFAITKRLVSLGYSVYLVGRDKNRVASKIGELDEGGRIYSAIADVINEDSLSALFRKIINKHGSLFAVLNATGVFEPFGKFEEVSIKKHLRPLDINLIGSMKVVHKILPIFKEQNHGKIILFSGGGVGGDMSLVNASSYFVSKASISVFTEVIAEEAEDRNIQINAILPSQILTKSTKKTLKISREKLGPVLGPATDALQNTGGNTMEKVLDLVEFLLSENSNHISGRTLSAKWDDLNVLKKEINDERFKLRRIDGRIYRKIRV